MRVNATMPLASQSAASSPAAARTAARADTGNTPTSAGSFPSASATKIARSRAPIPTGQRAPLQEQRDPTGIRASRGLRRIPSKTQMPQELIRCKDKFKIII